MWYQRMPYYLDLKNPRTFNEKLQWLKLYDRKPIYTTMVDKYSAKEYVSKIIGQQFIIPTLGVWDSFEQIDFDSLPNQFVLKCTHDCGGIIICKDKHKLDLIKTKIIIENCLKNNFFNFGREWPYKNVKKRIIAEKYLEDRLHHDLFDYKFFCFNGIVKYFKIDFNRFSDHRANYYSRQCELQPFGEAYCPPDFEKKLVIPKTINKMITLAEQLVTGIPFVRVDFYSIEDNIYFGELTFYPNSGTCRFIPNKWDEVLGDFIELPSKSEIII